MSKYPDLIYTVLSSKEFPDEFSYDLAVDWAYEMLEYGYETEHLLILAATSKPTNRLESGLYLEKAVEELKLFYLDKREAALGLVFYNVKELSLGKSIFQNLSDINNVNNASDYGLDELTDFSLLYEAWWEVESPSGSDFYVDFYWEGATLMNIRSIVLSYAKTWLEKYQPVLAQLLPQ